MSEISGSARLSQYLAAHPGVAELIRPGVAMPTVPLAAAALGVPPAQVVKSILLQGKKDATVLALAVVPGDLRIAPGKVSQALGLSGLRLATPEAVLAATGYSVGGVPPVGHATLLLAVVDSRVLAMASVYGGGGDEEHMLRISPADIVRLTGARVADITSDG